MAHSVQAILTRLHERMLSRAEAAESMAKDNALRALCDSPEENKPTYEARAKTFWEERRVWKEAAAEVGAEWKKHSA